MVSDFIDEHNGYLAHTQEKYDRVKESIKPFHTTASKKVSRVWRSKGEMAVRITEVKCPQKVGWRHGWIFNHSSCHRAMAEDLLDVKKMNVNPGGKQP